METRTQMFESIDNLANLTGQKELCEAIKKVYDACFEGHKDRTTGGNFGGKTIRDQNNYDHEFGTYKDTKTAPITRRRYGFTKDGVKGMGVAGKFGSAWDIKSDGLNSTGTNSPFSKSGRAVMKAGEKRFFDPRKVLERDELAGERELEDIVSENNYQDMVSDSNYRHYKLNHATDDQLDNTASSWNGRNSTHVYDYDKDHPMSQRDAFAGEYADRFYDENYGNEKWTDLYRKGLERYDDDKEFDNSDEGKRFSRDMFEKYYERFSEEPSEELSENETTSADDMADLAWDRADYVSGDMFGESIDKLAKATGQKDLCEAVKKLYKACFESTADDIDNYNSLVRTLKQEGANITDAASFVNALSEHGIKATIENDTVTVQRPDGTFDDYKPWGQFTNGTPRWVKLWSDDYGKMNYLDPSSLLVDVFMAAHKLPDV